MMGGPSRDEIRSALENKRNEFLSQMRGRSEAYDRIRQLARMFVKATAARDTVVPMIESVLIMQLQAARDEAKEARVKEIALAVEAERVRIRGSIG